MNHYVLNTNIQLPKTPSAPSSFHPYVLEPIRPAILLEQELLAVRKPARDTSLAFGGVGAVEVGDVLVAYIAEPAYKSRKGVVNFEVCGHGGLDWDGG